MTTDLNYLKKAILTLALSADERDAPDLGARFYSYDKQSGKFIVRLIDEEDQPVDLSQFAIINMVMAPNQDISKGRTIVPMQAEDPEDGVVSVILPDNIRQFNGTIIAGVVAMNADNIKTHDFGYFRFEMQQSLIDANIENLPDFYVGEFEQLRRRVHQIMQDILNDIDAFKLSIDSINSQIQELQNKLNDVDYYSRAEVDSKVNTLISGKADKTDLALTNSKVVDLDSVKADKTFVDAQFASKEQEVTAQLADIPNQSYIKDKSAIKNNTETYIPVANISAKAVYNSGGHIFVVTPKPNGKGYIRFRLRENVIDTSPSSVGGNGQFYRPVEVLNTPDCFILENIATLDSGTNWLSVNMPYGSHTIACKSLSVPTLNAFVEYQIVIPNGTYSTAALVWTSSGSASNVDISVDGIVKVSGVSLQATPSAWKEIYIPVTPGTHTIRLETKVSGYMTIAGTNKVNLNDYKDGYSYDTIVVNAQPTNPYITNAGAIDYAMLDADTNLYCGSYHGGETRSRLACILDNVTIALTDGSKFIGNVLEIEQDTSIVSKLNTNSRFIFKHNGLLEFEVYFRGNINLTRLFTNMTTTHVDYTEVVYPKKVNVAVNGTYYMPLGTNYVVQKNPINNQKITTVMNDNILPVGTSILPYVQTSQYYKKLYKENIKSDTPVNFTEGNFKSIHVFE